MKSAQISGLLITILASVYLYSFAHRISDPTDSAPTVGFGIVLVFFMLLTSAVILISSSFRLWSREVRLKEGFVDKWWGALLVINSLLAIIYTTAIVAGVVVILKTAYGN